MNLSLFLGESVRRIAANWADPMATDVSLGAIRSREPSSASIQNGDWCEVFPALDRNIANADVYFYLAIKSKAGSYSLFDTPAKW